MPSFEYKGRRTAGTAVTGVVEAGSQAEAVRKVQALGCAPLDVRLVAEASKNTVRSVNALASGSIVPLKSLAVFFRQFDDLLEGGIPLARALQLMAAQKHPPELQRALDGLLRMVVDGKSLSDSMAVYPGVFPVMHVQMIRAGEISGSLNEVMGRMAGFIEQDLQTRARVRDGLMYPGIVLVVGCLTLFVIMTFVVPRMTAMFDDFGSELPLATKIVLAAAGFLENYWWLVAGGLAVIVTGGYRYLRTAAGRAWASHFLLGLPIIGKFFLQVDLVRFSRTLATLIENGVAIALAVDAAARVADNVVLRESLQKAAVRVREGSSLVLALRGIKLIPNVGITLISVGEETGHLERGLFKMASLMERENEEVLGTFFALLGPVLLVAVAGMVGFLVIAMLLPIFSMNSIAR